MANQTTASLLTPPPPSRATPGTPLSNHTASLSKGTAPLSNHTASLSKGMAPLSNHTASRPRPATPDKDWAQLPAKRSVVGPSVKPWAVLSTRLPVHPPSLLTAGTSNPVPVPARRQVTVLTRRDSFTLSDPT